MDSWQEHRSDPELDAAIMRARMRRPAQLRLVSSPAIQQRIASLSTGGLPDPQAVVLTATRRRMVAEMAAEIRQSRLTALVASVDRTAPRTAARTPARPRTPARASGLDRLRELVASAGTWPMDLTKPVRRDRVRAAYAATEVRAGTHRRGT
jgi:hypothetical protein